MITAVSTVSDRAVSLTAVPSAGSRHLRRPTTQPRTSRPLGLAIVSVGVAALLLGTVAETSTACGGSALTTADIELPVVVSLAV